MKERGGERMNKGREGRRRVRRNKGKRLYAISMCSMERKDIGSRKE